MSGAPGKPQAKEVTSTHIKLSWTKPITFADEEVLMYAVYFRPSTGPTPLWERMQTNGPEEYIIITDLIEGDVPFIFKVCAVSNFSEGVESEESDEILLTKVSPKDASLEKTPGEGYKFQDSCTSKEALMTGDALFHQEGINVDISCSPDKLRFKDLASKHLVQGKYANNLCG